MITFTTHLLENAEDRKRFKDTVSEHKKEGREAFVFDGHNFHLGYAEYLIEFLESEHAPA